MASARCQRRSYFLLLLCRNRGASPQTETVRELRLDTNTDNFARNCSIIAQDGLQRNESLKPASEYFPRGRVLGNVN